MGESELKVLISGIFQGKINSIYAKTGEQKAFQEISSQLILLTNGRLCLKHMKHRNNVSNNEKHLFFAKICLH